jgi:hypothetical protein
MVQKDRPKLAQIFSGYIGLLKRWFYLLPIDQIEVADMRKDVCDNCEIQSHLFGLDYCDNAKGGCGCIGIAKRQCMDCECPFNNWGKENLYKS